MRISSRSQSPAAPLPPLQSLPSMSSSWAFEAEKEVAHERMKNEAAEAKQGGRFGWIASKASNRDEELCRGEAARICNSVSKSYRSRWNRHDKLTALRSHNLNDEVICSRWKRNRTQEFTSASRCYPPSAQSRDADWHLRRAEGKQKAAHLRRPFQECNVNGNRISGSEIPCRSQYSGSKIGDRSFTVLDGVLKHRLACSEDPLLSQTRLKRRREKKMALEGNADSFGRYVRKLPNVTEAYNSVETGPLKERPLLDCADGDKESLIQEIGPLLGHKYQKLLTSNSENLGENPVPNRLTVDSDIENMSEESIDVNLDVEAVEAASAAKLTGDHTPIPARCNVQQQINRNNPSVSRVALVDVTNRFKLHVAPVAKVEAQETDAHRLSQRQRQIEYGKNTLGYERYSELVPKYKRKAKDPHTPNPKQGCSKRSWDGQIRKWRRLLHVYDPPREDGEEIAEDFGVLKLQRSSTQDTDFQPANDSSFAHRLCEMDEIPDQGKAKRADEDASLTIYHDWMEI